MLPKDEDDSKNAIVEIRAGTGGLEACYFAQTYLKCTKSLLKKWKMDIISISKSEAGGFKEFFLLMEMIFILI